MSWRIEDHPEGGLQITHLVAPRFTARWTTGDFPIESVREGSFFWTDEGRGHDDSIHLYEFAWDEWPDHQVMKSLMDEAIKCIESYVLED